MTSELPKNYDSAAIEQFAKQVWDNGNYFHAEPADSESFTIVIPPPNVTAPLHLGHALNNTLQDILIRFKRMQGFNALWMPGTDHAGIATQTVVEKRILSEEGRKRTDFARDEFVARVQAWKDEYEAKIISQLKAIGCSCDWARTRFTMDDTCAAAVRETFFRLFKDGLIYRGKRLVNWDPVTQTVLADDEVEHESVNGSFWYMRYPLTEPVKGDNGVIEYVTVATTRPETMLGDTAVAMNPSDKRAAFLVGKSVRLPIVGRIIPIVADEHVVLPNPDSDDDKAKFSTGFLKVTPAHDPDDWQIGQRHGLDIINVMAPDGSISDKFGWEDCDQPEAQSLLGMDRFEAREAVVEWFRTEKLLEDIRPYTHEVGHSYRSHVPIEPYLSDQWYIAVKKPIEHLNGKFGQGLIDGTDVAVNSLAGLALKPLVDGRVRFIPDRYAKTYQGWLENLRDWPISRQLWWGHQIPIWYAELDVNNYDSTQNYEFQNQFKAEFDELSEAAGLGRSFAYQFNHNNFAEVYICPSSKKADLLISEFRDFSKSREAERRMPGQSTPIAMSSLPNFPNATEQALNLCFKLDVKKCDEDVLDTWFSSALWPFSTMGWPQDTAELKSFYPGNVLCTAREIITLWVSRMVMMGQYCAGDIPFTDVYIHAMIQDGQGRKMSKSLGNGIDPMIAIDSHGADAMRFTLASMTTDTQDVRMPVEPMQLPDGRKVNTSPKFDIGRNFCNKVWNASRFAMMNLEATDPEKFDKTKMTLADKWILSRLCKTIDTVTKSIEEFKFSEPLMELYRFFWNDLCDWYLEWAKPRMSTGSDRPIAQNMLAFVLDRVLCLLHPFVPFITEGIYQQLNQIAPSRGLKGICRMKDRGGLIVSGWPELSFVDEDAEKKIDLIQSVIKTLRDLRSKYNKAPSEKLSASVNADTVVSGTLNENCELICQLAGLSEFSASGQKTKPDNAAAAIVEQMQIYLHNAVDIEAERTRLEKQRQDLEKLKNSVDAKLANENFISRAKPEVVAQTKEKSQEVARQLEMIEKHLAELG